MLDDILQIVKDHLGNNPAVAAAIPADQADAIHNEIANHINNAASQPAQQSVLRAVVCSVEFPGSRPGERGAQVVGASPAVFCR